MFNSVFTLAFSLDHQNADGSDITAEQVRLALRQRYFELSFNDDELLNAVGSLEPEDTYEFDN